MITPKLAASIAGTAGIALAALAPHGDPEPGKNQASLTPISGPLNDGPVSVVPPVLPAETVPTTPAPAATTTTHTHPPRAARTQTNPTPAETSHEVPVSSPATPEPSHSSEFLTASASWYGPGLYGNGTACGQKYTPEIIGVAHKTLPCGTQVTFRHAGREITAPVIDRGPYTKGRMWDLSHGLCQALAHCFTGQIEYAIR